MQCKEKWTAADRASTLQKLRFLPFKIKFADRIHLDAFRFHLESTFAHKLFVSNDNSLLNRPTQGKDNGILTALRSEYPGFDAAAEVFYFTFPGCYLVGLIMLQFHTKCACTVEKAEEVVLLFKSLDERF